MFYHPTPEQQAYQEAREQEAEMERFEALSYGVSPEFAKCVARPETWENKLDRMEREEDRQLYDDEGRVP